MQTIEEHFQRISHFISECEAQHHVGQTVDLSPLEPMVRILCNTVIALPPDSGNIFREQLEHVRDRIDTLARTMELTPDQVREQLDRVASFSQAAMAYKKQSDAS